MGTSTDPLDFKDRSAWRSWLKDHHTAASCAWLVIQKKSSKLDGLRLEEAVQEALCYGWIDGKLKRLDDQRFLLRFSPRKPLSVWSITNIQRVEELIRVGAMTEAGLAAVEAAKESGQWQNALDREQPDKIPPELEAALRQKRGALAAYRDLTDTKKKQYLYWLQSARREGTKRKRIEEIVKQVLKG
jgi:uncharacterized protein YdeI (YjbR/CyaY-like superfamily)